MDDVLVSIITPTYNHEKYIKKCVESVLSQSYPNWEQIIIDDGSHDNTAEIISKYDDKRIKFIKQTNKGIFRLNESYNTALKRSKGQLIAVLEGDDFWPSDKLEKEIKIFSNPNVVLCWGKSIYTNNKGDFLGYKPKSIHWIKNTSVNERFKYLFFGNYIPACTVMCRKDVLIKIGGFKQTPETPYVDHLTWLELGLKGDLFYLDDVLGYWRHHSRQISSIMSLELFKSLKYPMKIYENLKPENNIQITFKDLTKYNLMQLKYNIIHFMENKDKNVSEDEDKDQSLEQSTFKRLINSLKIFYALLKNNINWTALILKKNF